MDLSTNVMFSSSFGVRHYPKISINEENRKASWRRAGSASRHLHLLPFRLIFYQVRADFSLWHSWQKASPKNQWLIVKLGISVDPSILLLLMRSNPATDLNTCTLQRAPSAIKVMENNCYTLACAKTNVFQHRCFGFCEINTQNMETSGYFKISMVMDTNVTAKQCPALQNGLFGRNMKQLDQKLHTFLPPLLSLPSSSCFLLSHHFYPSS